MAEREDTELITLYSDVKTKCQMVVVSLYCYRQDHAPAR